jgi:hypothetical protein
MTEQTANKRVTMPMIGQDGNAYSILGRFQRAARRAGWMADEITAVLNEAQSGDYDHLLQTMMAHTNEPDLDDDESEE